MSFMIFAVIFKGYKWGFSAPGVSQTITINLNPVLINSGYIKILCTIIKLLSVNTKLTHISHQNIGQ